MYEIDTTFFSVNLCILKSWQTNIQLGDQIRVCGWLGTYGARTSTGTVKIKFMCMTHELHSVHQGTYGMLRSSQNNIQLGDQHQIWGRPGTYWAKTSTDTVKIKFTYKKQELKWISKWNQNTVYTVILTKQMQVKSSVSVDGLAHLGPSHPQALWRP